MTNNNFDRFDWYIYSLIKVTLNHYFFSTSVFSKSAFLQTVFSKLAFPSRSFPSRPKSSRPFSSLSFPGWPFSSRSFPSWPYQVCFFQVGIFNYKSIPNRFTKEQNVRYFCAWKQERVFLASKHKNMIDVKSKIIIQLHQAETSIQRKC